MPMKTDNENTLRRCSLCHGMKPASEFYIVNKRTGKHDAYCKCCRRLKNRLRRQGGNSAETDEKPRRRTLICEETDPQRRMQLIRQARLNVRQSVMRKAQQLREAEAAAYEP